MGNFNLFCFPFAGGSSTYYLKWANDINDSIDLHLIELAGRGRRINEPLYNNVNEIVVDIYEQINEELSEKPYAFFGHSMGSLIAYELTRYIHQKQNSLPTHVFFSGSNPPHKRLKSFVHQLTDEKLKQKMMLLEGTPKEVLECEELMELILPIFKADFKVTEEYRCDLQREYLKLSCPITVLNGTQDAMIDFHDIGEWSKFTTEDCNFRQFVGGHFFINEHMRDVVEIINATMVEKQKQFI
ncbi:thioesterase II family protein [Bacillus gaemokensis]|uniref:Thioesterase domain-containing protein n=1 Tax=Bacillus gaemokensis TaxID=574375 RepID=A0A073KFD8_9BACI|nr:thioesterase domain-containing protein [Bacillus gaemokensis]KEK25305.1 hypothetical protein BAGA_11795 [Bacillus gaemokensis]KYG37251.1 hypothetical protein AZF08_07545 [Bacillus gaemokensis]